VASHGLADHSCKINDSGWTVHDALQLNYRSAASYIQPIQEVAIVNSCNYECRNNVQIRENLVYAIGQPAGNERISTIV